MKITAAGFLILVMFATSYAQSLETIIQHGHELEVVSVTVSPDSNLVATGSIDKTIKLWDLTSAREVRTFFGHQKSVRAIDFSKDGKLIASCGNDVMAKIWDVYTGKEIYSVKFKDDFLTDIAFSPDQQYVIVTGNHINPTDSAHIISVSQKKVVKSIGIDADQNRGSYVTFSPDGKMFALGETNHTAVFYQTGTWKELFRIKNKDESFNCGSCLCRVAFGSDNKSFFIASNNGPVRKYNLSSKQMTVQFVEKLELGGEFTIDVSRDNKKLLLTNEKDITIWDTDSGKELYKIEPVPKDIGINQTVFTLDGKRIITSCNDNTGIVWDLKFNKAVNVLKGFVNLTDKDSHLFSTTDHNEWHSYQVVRFKDKVKISQDGKRIFSKAGKGIEEWDIASGKTLTEFKGHTKELICFDLSSDNKLMITGGGDGQLFVWNTETGLSTKSIQVVAPSSGYSRPMIVDVALNKDATRVLTTSWWDRKMKIYDLASNEITSQFNFGNDEDVPDNCIWSNNENYIFASQGSLLRMWEIDSRKVAREFVGHFDYISSIRLSPDNTKLVSTSWDGSTCIWDISTGLLIARFKGFGPIHSGIFSDDGRLVYSAGADRIVREWDIATSKLIRTFEGHKAEISSLTLGKENTLISHSVDGSTKFWDLKTGKEFFDHISLTENDWLVKTTDGYFNCTDNARQFIHFVDGVKTYSIDQFFNEFYRPDLLPKLFNERGSGRSMDNIQGKLKSAPPPGVKVALLQKSDPTKAEVHVKITDTGGGVVSISLFHNGKNIPVNFTELKLPSGTGQRTEYIQEITLIGGSNTISVSATNKENIESELSSVDFISEESSKSSTCYVLAVGINKYKNSKMELNYARPDAESFSTVIAAEGSLFEKVELHQIYDTDASRENILKELDAIAAVARQEDVFVFYYAGHGSMVENQFFFIPAESTRLYDQGSLRKEAIEASIIQDKLKNIKVLKQLIIMDACQSGGSVELLATRGASEEKAIAQLSRSAGIHVMASANSAQFAAEFTSLGHGAFTYLLIKGLKGEADGAPKDGKVTIYELKSYLDDQVPELTKKLKGKSQYPYTFSRGQDFPIAIID